MSFFLYIAALIQDYALDFTPYTGCLSMLPQLQYLNLSPASQLTVLVTDVSSPAAFCAQPSGLELVQLMDDMG